MIMLSCTLGLSIIMVWVFFMIGIDGGVTLIEPNKFILYTEIILFSCVGVYVSMAFWQSIGDIIEK